MKKTAFITILLSLFVTSLAAQDFYLDDNGVTVRCEDADIGDTDQVNGVTYTKRTADQITIENAATTCTSGIEDMNSLFSFSFDFNGDISSWDVSSVTNMADMFRQATSFDGDISSWDVSSVTTMSSMFSGAELFNGDLSSWDVSSVTVMTSMFSAARSFNQDIGDWDVSSVTEMGSMFSGANSFDQDINGWDVSSVTRMSGMFRRADSFNQPIGNWDVSSVFQFGSMFLLAPAFDQDISNWDTSSARIMSEMFAGAVSFNQPIGNWDVSLAWDMQSMFSGAESFNQDIENWDVSSVTNMAAMFWNASAFNQDISGWNVSSVTTMSFKFNNAGLSPENFDQALNGWSELELQQGVALSAEGLHYCNGGEARQILIDEFSWVIEGDLLAPGCPAEEPPVAANSNLLAADDNGEPVSFGETGVTITFSGIESEGEVSVSRFNSAPDNTDGIGEELQVAGQRIVINASDELDFDEAVLRINVDELEIDDPENITVYRRAEAGSGTFEMLDSEYDAESGELIVTLDSFSEFAFTTGIITSALTEGGQPVSFELHQNYPNPFNPSTVIEFELPANSEVRLEVYNMLGQRIATLVNEQKSAGRHQVSFDASALSSGIYIYRISAEDFQQTRKMMLMK